MRLVLAAILLCSSSGAFGQQLDFGSRLSRGEAEAANNLLDGEPGFNLSTITVARLRLNDDEVDDLVILFKRPAVCAARGCEGHVLLSHRGPGGVAEMYQDAFASSVRRIALGPIIDGRRALRIDGRVRRWDGKTFR
jgi:hypothetical protein